MALGPNVLSRLGWELNVTPLVRWFDCDSSGSPFDASCGFGCATTRVGPFGSFGTARGSLSQDRIGLGFESCDSRF